MFTKKFYKKEEGRKRKKEKVCSTEIHHGRVISYLEVILLLRTVGTEILVKLLEFYEKNI